MKQSETWQIYISSLLVRFMIRQRGKNRKKVYEKTPPHGIQRGSGLAWRPSLLSVHHLNNLDIIRTKWSRSQQTILHAFEAAIDKPKSGTHCCFSRYSPSCVSMSNQHMLKTIIYSTFDFITIAEKNDVSLHVFFTPI